MIKNILFPIDFSDTSMNALSYALAVARTTDARLFLIHIYSIPVTDSEMLDDMLILKERKIRKKMKDLKKEIMNYKENSRLAIDTIVIEGDLIHEINRKASRLNIDLLIAGSHRSTNIEMIMGTTTTSLMKECICPVMVIPEKVTFKDIKKIVFAKDLDKAVQDPDLLEDLANVFHSEVEMIEFKKNNHDYNFYPKTKEISADINQYHTDLESGLKQFVNHVHPQIFAMISDEEEQTEALNAGVTKRLASSFDIPLLALNRNKLFANRVYL